MVFVTEFLILSDILYFFVYSIVQVCGAISLTFLLSIHAMATFFPLVLAFWGIISLFAIFSRQIYLVVFHLLPETIIIIFVDLKSARVWMILIFTLNSNSSRLLSKRFGLFCGYQLQLYRLDLHGYTVFMVHWSLRENIHIPFSKTEPLIETVLGAGIRQVWWRLCTWDINEKCQHVEINSLLPYIYIYIYI